MAADARLLDARIGGANKSVTTIEGLSLKARIPCKLRGRNSTYRNAVIAKPDR
jgi:hypothetical protein